METAQDVYFTLLNGYLDGLARPYGKGSTRQVERNKGRHDMLVLAAMGTFDLVQEDAVVRVNSDLDERRTARAQS